MKCLSCDCILSDKEATRKYSETDQYIDLCDNCLSMSDMFDETFGGIIGEELSTVSEEDTLLFDEDKHELLPS